MGLVIGMDEAGYGPRLGPLVVTATVWEVPGDPRKVDLWRLLESVVTPKPARDEHRLHLADSKQVYNAGKGLAALERTVLAALELCESRPQSFRELCGVLAPDAVCELNAEPWFDDADLPLPHGSSSQPTGNTAADWKDCCCRHGIQLRAIRSDVVLTERFNRLTRDCGTKGAALSTTTFRLLRSVWDPDDPQPVLVVGDKHGGRNRYDQLLDDVLDGQMIFRRQESTPLSVYQVKSTELRFQAKGESQLPVALASMVCKYIRELAMTLFNRFWNSHLPELKPTEGYTTDANRYRSEIAGAQANLGISNDLLWRMR
mgnify:CR=1 FL=1